MSYEIAPGVDAALGSFKVPERLGFGLVSAPVMYSVDWAEGAWGRGRLLPYGPIEILPGARVLQYAELVFEQADLLADTGLRGKQRLGGVGDIQALPGHFAQVAQLL